LGQGPARLAQEGKKEEGLAGWAKERRGSWQTWAGEKRKGKGFFLFHFKEFEGDLKRGFQKELWRENFKWNFWGDSNGILR
jgi:hypothetical protein